MTSRSLSLSLQELNMMLEVATMAATVVAREYLLHGRSTIVTNGNSVTQILRPLVQERLPAICRRIFENNLNHWPNAEADQILGVDHAPLPSHIDDQIALLAETQSAPHNSFQDQIPALDVIDNPASQEADVFLGQPPFTSELDSPDELLEAMANSRLAFLDSEHRLANFPDELENTEEYLWDLNPFPDSNFQIEELFSQIVDTKKAESSNFERQTNETVDGEAHE
jgi:hypothetical protein